jgi:hypothetical protein
VGWVVLASGGIWLNPTKKPNGLNSIIKETFNEEILTQSEQGRTNVAANPLSPFQAPPWLM